MEVDFAHLMWANIYIYPKRKDAKANLLKGDGPQLTSFVRWDGGSNLVAVI